MLFRSIAVTGGEIFNVGSNNMNYRIYDLAKKINKVIPHAKIEHINNKEDSRNYRVSFDKIRNIIGFSCSKKMEDGIIEIKKALENDLITNYKDPKYNNYNLLKEFGIEKNFFPFKIGIS